MYGIDVFPSIIMMQYGPVGYVPTISIYLSNSLGILIIPINIVMIIIVSALVGLNVVSSIHTLRVYNLEKKEEIDHFLSREWDQIFKYPWCNIKSIYCLSYLCIILFI